MQAFFLSIRLDIHYLIEMLHILIQPKDYEKAKSKVLYVVLIENHSVFNNTDEIEITIILSL